MKLFFDLLPVALFFVVGKLADVFAATAVSSAATILLIGVSFAKHRKIEPIHLVTLVVVLVFGGATLWLKDPFFVQIKPTVLDWIFALLLGGGQLLGKNPLRAVLSGQLVLPAPIWSTLNRIWTLFFVMAGAANLWVVLCFPYEIWLNYMVPGARGLMLAFSIAQGFWLAKHMEEPTR